MEFPNYTQLEPRFPRWFWQVARVLTLLLTFFIIYTLFAQPDLGLVLFWKLIIPLLPISFAIVPGLWRNVCPMAFLNQMPRMLGKGLQRELPVGIRSVAMMLSIIAFVVFVSARAPLLNHSGTAVGVMLVSVLILALVGGLIFKGRSGWCGTFCPLAPLQKVYGQAPLLMVRNGYCEPCLGCQKNCYDFNPRAAVFSDVYDLDHEWSDHRKLFTALLPGLIIGFFTAVSPSDAGLLAYYAAILTLPLISVGLYYVIHNMIHISEYRLLALFGMAALGIFYWFGAPVVANGIEQVFGLTLPAVAISTIQFVAIIVCVLVMVRGFLAERAYMLAGEAAAVANVGSGMHMLKEAVKDSLDNVHVMDRASGKQIDVKSGQNLLDAIEQAGLPIMPGCRMGTCGSDPIVIIEGEDRLAPPDENELTTLRRLGLEGKARLACCCKPQGKLVVDLDAAPETFTDNDAANDVDEVAKTDRATIIIVGNGIAGISTAEHIREQEKDCRIILISDEQHHFYNRMGLEQVVHGRVAMQGLYLMEEEWYRHNDIEIWLNTRVNTINKEFKLVELGTGQRLDYDKLVLATGASALVPPIPGADMPGCFSLRSAADALDMRAWVQAYTCKQAVVLGGGVLGIEAAEALQQLGLRVTIVHTSHQLMNRQLDLHAAVILRQHLTNKGVDIVTNNSIKRIAGEGRIHHVVLDNDNTLPADLLLFCIGIRANTALAESAGLEINRGVVINQQMQTSDENIYCVGDAAELPGSISGLWSVGNEQGKVAAATLLGKTKAYDAIALPPVQLKVSGIDVKSFGAIESGDEIKEYTAGNTEKKLWKHLYVQNNRVIGGVFINAGQTINAAMILAKNTDKPLSRDDIQAMMSGDKP